MRIYKNLILCVFSFMALEGTLYGEKIDVDIYIEGPGLNGQLKQFPNPVFDVFVGGLSQGNYFSIEGADLELSNQRLLKKGASLEVKPLQNYFIIPPVGYQVLEDKDNAVRRQSCGAEGGKIRAYNGAGKPLKSITLMTAMRIEKVKYPPYELHYIGDCSVKTEYHE